MITCTYDIYTNCTFKVNDEYDQDDERLTCRVTTSHSKPEEVVILTFDYDPQTGKQIETGCVYLNYDQLRDVYKILGTILGN
jgi:hypothetical protein